MKPKQPVIAVFDIGKTNKKLLVFDVDYQLVSELVTTFEEDVDDDGFACENIERLTAWILSYYQLLKQSEEFELKAVNFTTYGASLLYIDADGKRISPLYNYLKPYPPYLLNQFYASYGDTEKISVETSSPIMGHLNAGLQLYWFKYQKPQMYERLDTVMHFPQFLSFQLTGKKFAEMTNVGCHSAMWNFKENRYHQWLEKEGILAALSPVVKGNRAVKMEEKGGACEIAVGIGLHDSSAAIIPYLASFREPFVIVSTGTWTISLNPFNSELPQKEDLVKGGLSYLTYEGDPVKVSMLFAGHHHDQQINRIAGYFDVQADDLRSLQYDPVLIRSIRENMQDDLLFNVTPGSNVATEPCVFHLRNLSRFNSAAQAYHCLVRDVIDQQAVATKTILSNSNVKKMYVDGGFCKNAVYMQLLSDAFPEMEVYSSSLIQGTALGAALAIHQEWNARELPDTLIKLKRWPKSPESVVQSD